MEDELETFLRSRNVTEEDINHMKMDKIDQAVFCIMTDEERAKYIPSYGNRLAVLSFCRQREVNTDQEAILNSLRQKIATRRMKRTSSLRRPTPTSSLMARPNNTNAVKSKRRIEVGWMHFQNSDFHQVRSKNGGGTRHLTLDKTTTVSQIQEIAKDLFFPEGQSPKGSTADFTFSMCDFKKQAVSLESTLTDLYEQSKLRMLRLYLCTKDFAQCVSDESSEDCDLFQQNKIGVRDQLEQLQTSTSDVSALANAVQNPLPQEIEHPSTSQHLVTDRVGFLSVAQPTLPDDSELHGTMYYFDADEVQILDPVLHSTPETAHHGNTRQYFTLNDNTEEFNLIQDTPMIVCNIDQIDVLAEMEDSGIVQLGPQPENADVTLATTVLWDQDHSEVNGTNHLEVPKTSLQLEDEPLTAENVVSQPSSPEEPQNPKETMYVHVCRAKIVEDLLNIFTDKQVVNMKLKMEFKNEMAVDDSGVSREVYTAFWEQFLEQCEGEEERVPRLRPDFSEIQWQAIGRIWAKGLTDHGVIPVRLSKAFIMACIFGLESVDEAVLMSSFSNYLSDSERITVEKALHGTLDEDEKEDLLDLFSRMGSHCVPTKQNTKVVIKIMAHKAVLQEPKFIIDCFSDSLQGVELNLPHPDNVLKLYESKKATNKKVAEMLQAQSVHLSQKEQSTFGYLQRYIRNADQRKLEKFLRFCTGSFVVCTKQIKVTFNAETGFGRRPVAHTCGAIIDVPYTYCSYPEFRTEFDNVLSSNFLLMDII